MRSVVSDACYAAFQQRVVRPFRAVEIFFPSGTLRLWTGNTTRQIKGNDFVGTGDILKFEDVEETNTIEAPDSRVILSGISNDLISLALNEPYQGAEVRLWLGEKSVPDDMFEIGSGVVDQMPIQLGITSSIAVKITNILAKLETPNVWYYTHEDQQLLFPGDMAFEFVPTIQDTVVTW